CGPDRRGDGGRGSRRGCRGRRGWRGARGGCCRGWRGRGRARRRGWRRLRRRVVQGPAPMALFRRTSKSADMTDEAPWLVIGLGNPGTQYAGTRHNVGFRVADVLADRVGGKYKAHKSRADVLETRMAGTRTVLAKPRSYMNESGGPVSGLVKFFKVPLDRV